jgi:hypothetical protein
VLSFYVGALRRVAVVAGVLRSRYAQSEIKGRQGSARHNLHVVHTSIRPYSLTGIIALARPRTLAPPVIRQHSKIRSATPPAFYTFVACTGAPTYA